MKLKKLIFQGIFFIVLISFFIFLLYCKSLAYDEGLGPSIDKSEGEWYVYYYGSASLDAINPETNNNFTYEDFTRNETHGWYEWNYKGVTYVVVAGATRELLDSGDYEKKDYIHYFKYGNSENDWSFDTFTFHFVDTQVDSKEYNAIVLDSRAECMNPETIGNPKKSQCIYIYTCEDTENNPYKEQNDKFNQENIIVSSTGTFSESADQSAEINKEANRRLKIERLVNFGDFLQKAIQSAAYETKTEDTILLYSKDEIKNNKEMQNEIDVGNAKTKPRNSDCLLNKTTVSNKVDNNKGKKEQIYTTETEIPVLKMDAYGMLSEQFDIFKINFFNKESNSRHWGYLQNEVFIIGRIIVLISATLIITLIIWRGIVTVSSSIRITPGERATSRLILNRLIRAIFMIAFVYVIAALAVNLYEKIVSIIVGKNNTLYYLRMTVEDTYSFNTNIIGRIRYQTLASNQDVAFGGAIGYAIYSSFYAILFFLMFIRTYIIAALIIIAPVTAVTYIGGFQEPEHGISIIFFFRNWLRFFTIFVFLPIFLLILYKILVSIGMGGII